ncbi:MAG: hypothetical protein OXG60_04735 [Chloroflexi bacterium]|nr:hypothetical protein [Chloroflexota bacterium]
MRIQLILVFILLTTSCQSVVERLGPGDRPSVGFLYLDLLYTDQFDGPGNWTSYDGGDSLKMAVEDGGYRIWLATRQYVWAQLPYTFDDVVIEAEVRQLSDFDHNAYGIACRLDPANSGRGYYFLIAGDGYYSIRWSNGRSLDEIVSAKPSGLINRGSSTNRIKAICLGDYLALWINDHFVAEARDSRASAGSVGLSAIMNYTGKTVEVAFDDLKIWRSALDEPGGGR